MRVTGYVTKGLEGSQPDWRSEEVGVTGPKDECLSYIGEVWTDMRPLSLRKKMEEDEKRRAAEEAEGNPNGEAESDQ